MEAEENAGSVESSCNTASAAPLTQTATSAVIDAQAGAASEAAVVEHAIPDNVASSSIRNSVSAVEEPDLLHEEETFQSLQSEVDSEEMHDAESNFLPTDIVVLIEDEDEQVQQETWEETAHMQQQIQEPQPLPQQQQEQEDLMVGDDEDALSMLDEPQEQLMEVAEEHHDEEPHDVGMELGLDLDLDLDDIDDVTSSSPDLSIYGDENRGDETPRRERRGNFYVPVNRINDAIQRLIARDDSSRATLADLLQQDTFMQRLRRLLFSLDHDRRRLLLQRAVENDGDNEEGEAGPGNDIELARAVANVSAEIGNSSRSLDGEIGFDGDVDNAAENGVRRVLEDELTENSIRFDTNLAAEHSYLGNMNRVPGVNYLEEGQKYRMMIFMHQHILFPGEVLPFMISETIIEADIDAQNGLLFGVCFPFMVDGGDGDGSDNENGNGIWSENGDGVGNKKDNIYGVTCQIYEKGTDSHGKTLIKSRALQRFVTKSNTFTSPPQYITAHPQLKSYGYVKILPEIFLREPLKCIDMGAMNRFRDTESMQYMYKRFQAAGTPWPVHIYDNYSITATVEKARAQLAQHKIDTMPTDPVHLSFWLVRNLHLSERIMIKIFITDSVNKRMKMIADTFKEDAMFTCRYCGNAIANCNELFAMSKHGVQTQYCNSAGYIHETNTVYQVLVDAVLYSGQPSTKFSWFPGYQWHIVVCRICSRHIGWEFKALEPNLVPKKFYGISSSNVRISTHAGNPRDVIFQNFMRMLRRHIH